MRRYLGLSELRENYRFSTILWYSLRSELAFVLRGGGHEQLTGDPDNPASSGDDMDVVEMKEFWRRLENTLTKRELEVLRLRIEGLTYREIAQECGITVKAVACRIARLRKKVEKIIGP